MKTVTEDRDSLQGNVEGIIWKCLNGKLFKVSVNAWGLTIKYVRSQGSVRADRERGLQMRTSELFGAKNLRFVEIYGVPARRGSVFHEFPVKFTLFTHLGLLMQCSLEVSPERMSHCAF